jgi:hypothetical protein
MIQREDGRIVLGGMRWVTPTKVRPFQLRIRQSSTNTHPPPTHHARTPHTTRHTHARTHARTHAPLGKGHAGRLDLCEGDQREAPRVPRRELPQPAGGQGTQPPTIAPPPTAALDCSGRTAVNGA